MDGNHQALVGHHQKIRPLNRLSRVLTSTVFTLFALVFVAPAYAADQTAAERGAVLYRECTPCHSFFRDTWQAGPPLQGLFGRQAGTAPGFEYSDALRESGIIWTEETVKAWLSDPLSFVPGSRKRGHTVWRDGRLDDLVAYIKRAQGTDARAPSSP